jgi:hypothetical protein
MSTASTTHTLNHSTDSFLVKESLTLQARLIDQVSRQWIALINLCIKLYEVFQPMVQEWWNKIDWSQILPSAWIPTYWNISRRQ